MENDTRYNSVPVVFGDASISIIRITSKQVLRDGSDFRRQNIQHDHVYYELHFIMGEDASFLVGEEKIVLHKGEYVVFPPGVKHSPRHPSSVNDVVFALSLEMCKGEMGYFHSIQQALNHAGCRPLTLEEGQAERILELFSVMESNGFREACLRKTLAYEVVFSILDQMNGFQTSDDVKDQSDRADRSKIMLDCMVNDYRYSLSDIAAELGYTTRHTTRLIRKQYGMNLGELRQIRMLDTAKLLLLQYPKLSLNQVAVQAGFNNADSMRRAFLKLEHKTSAEYREINLLNL